MEISIISCYNGSRYVNRIYDSIKIQAEDNVVEIIIIDVSSTDNLILKHERLDNTSRIPR